MNTEEAELAELVPAIGADPDGPGLRALRRTRLPAWSWARWDNADWRRRSDARVTNAIEQWHPKDGSLLVLARTGAGKTSGMIAWARRVTERHDRRWVAAGRPRFVVTDLGRYVTSHDLAAATKAWKFGTPEPEELVQAMATPILFLDELGAMAPAATLFRVLDARYMAGLPTLTCSGLSMAELTSTFGDAAVRRMFEGGALLDAHGEARG